MKKPAELDMIVQATLDDISLKEKVAIANMDESEVPYLQNVFDIYAIGHLGKDADMIKKVLQKIWEVLKETHRIRSVK